jgi:hypothetical protein
VVLVAERNDITDAFVDKGDTFAQTFLDHQTYGFIPGIPSAYTQPLYGFFLVPIYAIFGRSWVSVGLAHVLVAVGTAWLVYEIGRRQFEPTVGMVAAGIATLHPYVVWHDVHMNREILDEALAAAIVLLVLVVADRPRLPLAAFLGAVLGLAILGNVRLAALPLVVAAYLLWRSRQALAAAGVVVAAAALVLAPWVVRNDVSVGCIALTTDGRALWKANNVNTLETLRTGHWIDDVPPIQGAPPTPQDAGAFYESTGRVIHTDECAQMRFYRSRALDFIEDHPGEKARLAAVGARMLWQPAVTKTEGRPGAGTWLDVGRDFVEPAFIVVVFALAIAGAFLAPRPFVVLALALLAYPTAMAMLFVGETRYRVPWDFLPALLAAVALVAAWRRFRPG